MPAHRHCEPSGEAIQRAGYAPGLPRRYAPRNDEVRRWRPRKWQRCCVRHYHARPSSLRGTKQSSALYAPGLPRRSAPRNDGVRRTSLRGTKQSSALYAPGLPRRYAPRNDGVRRRRPREWQRCCVRHHLVRPSSLRAVRRSNPAPCMRLDCRVAPLLAMTKGGRRTWIAASLRSSQ
jgi:hypothetical protein